MRWRDEDSTAGDYQGPFTMAGVIDEVRIYDRALDGEEVQALSENDESKSAVLAMSFEGGEAKDRSGQPKGKRT